MPSIEAMPNQRPRSFLPAVTRSAGLALSLAIGFPLAAQNAWTQWSTAAGGNGHWYLVVRTHGNIQWAAARTAAQALGGDLATVTSAAENTFVFSLLSDPAYWRQLSNPTRVFGPWLGGFQAPGAATPASGWTWVSGEAWSYTHWSSGEPNDFQGLVEDRLHYFGGGTTPQSLWNDLQQTGLCPGFVVEATTPPIAAYLSIGSGCDTAGQAPPTLQPSTANDRPRIGTTTQLLVGNVPTTSTVVVFALGTSNLYADFGGTPERLPVSLAALGWTGCNLLVDPPVLLPMAIGAAPVTLDFPLPNQPALVGVAFFAQALLLSPNAVAMTRSLAGFVGP